MVESAAALAGRLAESVVALADALAERLFAITDVRAVMAAEICKGWGVA